MFGYPLALMARRARTLALATLVLALSGMAVAPAGAQSGDTAGLAQARQRADAAAAEINRISSELGVLDEDIRRAEAEAAAAQEELEALRGQVRDLAVRRYTELGDRSQDIGGDINQRERAKVLLATVTGDSTDAIDRYRATQAEVEASLAELAERQEDQAAALEDLQGQRARLDAELARLEELERQRLAEEQRRREEEARRAAQAEARAEAAEQAELLARQQAAADEGRARTATSSGSTSSTAGGGTTSAPAPTTTAPSGGGGGGGGGGSQIATGSWVCPVQGARSFVDSWGFPPPGRPGPPGGGPHVAPGHPGGAAGGRHGVVQERRHRRGLSFRLNGDDGNWYYGAHLDAFAGVTGGHHPAGTLVGYVGDTGDARGDRHPPALRDPHRGVRQRRQPLPDDRRPLLMAQGLDPTTANRSRSIVGCRGQDATGSGRARMPA